MTGGTTLCESMPESREAVTMDNRFNKLIINHLRQNRVEICLSILDLSLKLPKYQRWFDDSSGDRESFALRQFQVLVDCLGLYYRTGDEAYRDIYLGEILKVAHIPTFGLEQQHHDRDWVGASIRESMLRSGHRTMDRDAEDWFGSDLERMHQAITTPTRKWMDVLMVGDCFFLEVTSFLFASFQAQGIGLNPTFFGTLNPVELRDGLREKSRQPWAAVCYSPFTYTFSDHYNQSLTSGMGIADPRARRRIVEPSLALIRGHLDLIASQFDCPIFVHNSINVRRHNSTLADWLKIVASYRTRNRVRIETNRQLADHIEKVNSSTFSHVHLFDEHRFLSQFSEWQLGRRFYDSTAHHHTVLSRHVADRYRDLLETLVHLSSKKLVVCDLDNTLWEGEIGEGEIRHHCEHQLLLELRAEGCAPGDQFAERSAERPLARCWTRTTSSPARSIGLPNRVTSRGFNRNSI